MALKAPRGETEPVPRTDVGLGSVLSPQGFLVAVLYCFANKEVRTLPSPALLAPEHQFNAVVLAAAPQKPAKPLNLALTSAFLGWVLGAGLGSCQPQALRLCLSRGSVWGGHKKTDPKPAALPGEVGDEEEMAALEAGPPRALLHTVRGPGRCSDTASPSCSRRMSERCEELSLLLPDPTPSPTSAGTTRRCRPQERPS